MPGNKIFNYIIAAVVVLLILTALLWDRGVQTAGKEIFHEIRTYDGFKQSAYQPAGQTICPLPRRNNMTQVALTAPPIMAGEQPPKLIKQMGIEVVPISGGKVRITGVMGSSWADKAGLKRNDIITTFNKKSLSGLDGFIKAVGSAPPEKDYTVKVLRNGRTKKLVVTVGEGEMEGFTPIVPVAFNTTFVANPVNPANQGQFNLGYYQCPRCGNALFSHDSIIGQSPHCPICNSFMQRMK